MRTLPLAAAILLLSSLATIAVYWPGLYGPLIFDDFWNLAPVMRWLEGNQTALSTVLANPASIVESRPLAMASFMLSAWMGDGTIISFKLGNLALHLLCGILGYALLVEILSLDNQRRIQAKPIAACLAAIWLLHPLHASTTLYVVQRMTQLATFFSLISLISYICARQRLIRGEARAGTIMLLVAVPSAIAAGVLSKQSAAVAPLLCALIEIFYFRGRRPTAVFAFYAAAIGLPALVAVSILLLEPARLVGGYENWDFTWQQRLLTQPRVLIDYLSAWFVPRSASMGLYTDAYPVSRSLVDPLWTLGAIVAITGFTILAGLLRKTHPVIGFGFLFYLAGHSVEASFLPLEMYYEHRNYLPSWGLLIMVAGLIGAVQSHTTWRPRPALGWLAFSAFACVLAFATHGRARIWSDEIGIIRQGLAQHPDSLRARMDNVSYTVAAKDYAAGRTIMKPLLQHADARHRLVGRFDTELLNCLDGQPVDRDLLSEAVAHAAPQITVHEIHLSIFAEAATRDPICSPQSVTFAVALTDVADRAIAQPEGTQNKSTTRRVAAQLFARGGAWSSASEQAQKGWSANRTIPLGIIYARSLASIGEFDRASQIIRETHSLIRSHDEHWQRELALTEAFVEDLATSAASPADRP